MALAAAPSPAKIVFLIVLTTSRIALLRRMLNTRFRSLLRTAFFAPCVIAIYLSKCDNCTLSTKKNQSLSHPYHGHLEAFPAVRLKNDVY